MRHGELTLDEMLADPIVRLLMRRDGVEEAEVRALMERVGQRRAESRRQQAFKVAREICFAA